ncbi:putative WRKY transcription factor, plant [Helianthus debilis subsp. tardiflorus]
MEVDWDLHAVVRACCSTTTTTSSSSSTASTTATVATTVATTAGAASSWSLDAYNNQKRYSQNENFMGFFPDPFQFQTRNDNSIEQFLNDLNTPLEFPKLQKPPQSPQTLPISPLSVIGGLQDPPMSHYQHHHHHHHHHQKQQVQGKQQAFAISRCTTSNAQSTRSKKR